MVDHGSETLDFWSHARHAFLIFLQDTMAAWVPKIQGYTQNYPKLGAFMTEKSIANCWISWKFRPLSAVLRLKQIPRASRNQRVKDVIDLASHGVRGLENDQLLSQNHGICVICLQLRQT